MGERFYVVDLRPEWNSRPCVTLWRPNNNGYAYPLPWAGEYAASDLEPGYHTRVEGRRKIRFAVPCAVVAKLAVQPPAGLIDTNAGPVVLNNGTNRRALRRARLNIGGR